MLKNIFSKGIEFSSFYWEEEMRNKHKCLHYYLLVNKRKWWCYLWPSKLGSFSDFLFMNYLNVWTSGGLNRWTSGRNVFTLYSGWRSPKTSTTKNWYWNMVFVIVIVKTHHLTRTSLFILPRTGDTFLWLLRKRNLTVRARFIELQNEVLLERRRSQGQ